MGEENCGERPKGVEPHDCMYYVYILQCSDNSYYTGYTTDIQRRLKEHNDGLGSKITRSKLPVFLVHQELYHTKSEALIREAQIKSWSRAKKEALIKGDFNKLHELSRSTSARHSKRKIK